MAAEKAGKRKPEKGGNGEAPESGWFLAMGLGVLGSMAAVVALFAAVAVYDYFASPHARTLDMLASAAGYLAVGMGGFATGRKSRRRGLVYGAVVGVVFTASVLIAGAGSPASVAMTGTALKRLVLSAAAGGMGGMLGVASS